MNQLELPNHYPDWVKEFFNAPTEAIPGFISDWWDVGIHVTETERSLTVYDIPEIGGEPNEEPDVTFYGDQLRRRAELVRYSCALTIIDTAATAIQYSPASSLYRTVNELPLRLTFSEERGNEIFGGPWK